MNLYVFLNRASRPMRDALSRKLHHYYNYFFTVFMKKVFTEISRDRWPSHHISKVGKVWWHTWHTASMLKILLFCFDVTNWEPATKWQTEIQSDLHLRHGDVIYKLWQGTMAYEVYAILVSLVSSQHTFLVLIPLFITDIHKSR